jgi:Ca-activated chloride channel family protein
MEAAGCAGRDPVTQQAFANRIEAAKWAVKTFLKESVPAEVNVGLYVFDGAGRSERVPIAKDNRAELARAIDALAGGGNTPLNASIRFGVDQLLRQRARQLDYGEYYLVVATDGEATDGDTAPTVAYATQHGIPIITLGYCLKQDHPLARGSFSYRNANSPAELLAALKETQAEARYADVKPGGR